MNWLTRLIRDERGEAVVGEDDGSKIGGFREKEPDAPEGPSLMDALDGMDADFAPEPVSGEPDPTADEARETDDDADVQPEATSDEDDADAPEADDVRVDEGDPVEDELDDEIEDEIDDRRIRLRAPTEDGDDEIEFEIETEDPQIRAALERLQDNAQRAAVLQQGIDHLEEQRAQVEADMEELDEIEMRLRLDAPSFVAERLSDEMKREVALELLHDDSALTAIEEKIEEWRRKPSKREIDLANHRVQRMERQNRVKERLGQVRESRRKAKAILGAVNDLIPRTMSPADADRFRRDAVRELQEFARDRGGNLSVEDIPAVLSHRMKLYGITGHSKKKNNGTGARVRASTATERTGERVRKQVERRRKAGATAPATAGHVPSNRKPPKDTDLKGAFDWLDKQQDLRGL